MPPHLPRESDRHRPFLAAAVVGCVAAALVVGVVGLPDAGAALPAVARHAALVAVPHWGQYELVSSVVYGSRGFDTFGETFLLLAAVVSVTTLTRSREPRSQYVGESAAGESEQAEVDPADRPDPQETAARAAERQEEGGDSAEPRNADTQRLGRPGPEHSAAMTVVVRVGCRVAAVALGVMSVYIAAWGYTPGGGFPAGAAVAGVAILLYTALGQRAVRAVLRPAVVEPIELAGAAAIVTIGLLGLALKGSMFANFVPLARPATILAGGTNQLYSGSELVEVATGLLLAIFALLGMGHDWTRERGTDKPGPATFDRNEEA